jgi:HAD superfamily hydrolase (TIGR01509 family)
MICLTFIVKTSIAQAIGDAYYMMKRAIIFDFGGVLMKTLDYTPRHTWDDRLGLPRGTIERIVHGSESWRLAQLGALSLEAYWRDVAQQLQLAPDDLKQLQVDYFKGDYLDGDLLEYIQRLRRNGHVVALLSNDSPALRAKLEGLNIARLFDLIVISGELGHMKPAPEAYHAALNALKFPAEQTIFVDDMPANIAGAKAVGMIGIHYTSNMKLEEVLESLLIVE